MKKILSALFVLGTIAASAESYLYWMVGDTGTYSDYKYAKVLVAGTDTYLALSYDNGDSISGDYSGQYQVSKAISDSEAEYGAGFYADLSTFLGPNYSYVIELYNANNKFLAQSNPLAYSSAANYIVDSGTGVPGGGAWTGTGYAIPEPTSGMMLLLGVAALALRRRRRA